MREYLKPLIEEEILEIEDIVANSLNGVKESYEDLKDDKDSDDMSGND